MRSSSLSSRSHESSQADDESVSFIKRATLKDWEMTLVKKKTIKLTLERNDCFKGPKIRYSFRGIDTA